MRIWLIAIGLLALAVVGFLFVRGPSPSIIVAPEHIFDLGPLAVTNTMFTSWLVVLFLCTVAVVAGRSLRLVPSGFSGAVEGLVGGFYGMIEGIVGERNARRFFPLVATIFFYVLVSNYFGLLPVSNVIGRPEPGHGEKQVVFEQASIAGFDVALIPFGPQERDLAAGEEPIVAGEPGGQFSGLMSPFFRSVNTDINTPLAMAIFSFVFVEFWGFSAGGAGYLKKFFNFGRLLRGNAMGVIDVFVGLLELVSEFARMVSFTFRLFGNIFAGEVLLLMMGFLVPFVLVDVFYGLELFVGLIQSFVFAMLTLVFAQSAVQHHGAGDQHEPSAHAETAHAH
ncbi:MAG: ATP synthase F0 subunit A [Dehalococcoidia bacterium]|nr:ATP synthase F0 subunit A [Dehalococcoidia bacterium]